MFKKNQIYNILIFFFFVFLIFFRFHNAVNFNPYWGYDGGAHLKYIQVILAENRLPTWQDTYLAWHEPGFYYLYAGIGRLANNIFNQTDFLNFTVKFLQIASAYLSVLIIYLTYKISQAFSQNKKVQLAAVVSSGLISVMTETSNYLSNELLLAFFITLLLYLSAVVPQYRGTKADYFITFSKKEWNLKRVILVAILCGLALLTKLSALIFILSILIWFIYKSVYLKQIKWLSYGFLILIITAAIYSPWAIYKQNNIGSIWSVNAYENKLYQDEKKELDNDFFYRLNPQIFNNPFWMNSSNSFWTIIFADAFSDYFVISNNVDKLNGQQSADNSQQLTDSGRFVSANKFILSILLLYFSIFFVIIFIGGLIGLIWRCVSRKLKPSVNLLMLFFILGSFAALAFNVWQFPFLERGTLKASFILTVWPLLIIIGLAWLDLVLKKLKATFLWLPVGFIILIWAGLSVAVNWI